MRSPLYALRDFWRKLRSWRRFRFTSGGLVFTGGAFAVGFAAINTGNNLLYLLLGAMLGMIALSSWLSEKTIQRLEVRRRLPRGVTVGKPVRIVYHITNHKSRLPTLATSFVEAGLPGAAFVAHVAPGETVSARSENLFVQRGVYPLRTLTVSTSFPFGMFTKERDIELPGELVIWPRSDRMVTLPTPPGGRKRPRESEATVGAAGARGEYRGLREYRYGDDPKDIHWRSTARRGEPVVREYDLDAGDAVWICLDTRGEPGSRAEDAVETAAALAGRAFVEGKQFALATPSRHVEPGSGAGQMERVLDTLARVDFDGSSSAPRPPADPRRCALVSLVESAGASAEFGAVVEPGRRPAEDVPVADDPEPVQKGWWR